MLARDPLIAATALQTGLKKIISFPSHSRILNASDDTNVLAKGERAGAGSLAAGRHGGSPDCRGQRLFQWWRQPQLFVSQLEWRQSQLFEQQPQLQQRQFEPVIQFRLVQIVQFRQPQLFVRLKQQRQ